VILASEVLPAAEEMAARIPEAEREFARKAFAVKLLRGHIETKLIYQDALRTIPAERLPEIEKQIGEHFEKEEVPKRIEKAGVGSRRELDEKLQSLGTSLERTKRAFVQRMLAMQWLRQQNDLDPDISYDEMLDYYEKHLADFETPARARWEHLTVRIPRYTDGSEAYNKLAHMGNQLIEGVPMTDVLAAQPDGTPECQGGAQGWITKGSLEVSKTVEEAIFGLPVGRFSRIFQDKDGFHIVRVLEREGAERTPFHEAQAEIREKLRELRRQEQVEAYLARLREQIPVWTVFDDDPEVAQLIRQPDRSTN